MYNAPFPNPQQAGAGMGPMGPQQAPMQPAMMPPPGAMPPGAMPAQPAAPGGPGGMDPQTLAAIEQMIALGNQGKRGQMQRQIGLANQLRADAGSQLRGPRTGIANVGAAALNGYMAGKQMRDAEKTGMSLDEDRMKASRGLIDALRGAAA